MQVVAAGSNGRNKDTGEKAGTFILLKDSGLDWSTGSHEENWMHLDEFIK